MLNDRDEIARVPPIAARLVAQANPTTADTAHKPGRPERRSVAKRHIAGPVYCSGMFGVAKRMHNRGYGSPWSSNSDRPSTTNPHAS
jgi:hypothetical protein